MNLNSVNSFARSLCKKRYVYKHFLPGDVIFKDTLPVASPLVDPAPTFETFVLDDRAPICRWLKFWHKSAITLGEVVIIRKGWMTRKLIRHEAVHVEQWRSRGIGFAWRYVMNPAKYEASAEEGEDA